MAAGAAAFMGGNIVAYRVDASGTGALPVYLDEYRPDGTLVQSLPLPSGGSTPLTASSTTSEGLLGRSADGRCLVAPGYAAVAGGSDPKGAAASAVARAVAFVAAGGAVDATTTLGSTAFGTDAIRGAATADCTAAWLSGNGNSAGRGLWYAAKGAGTASRLNATNAQGITIAAGQLYTAFAGGATINRVGSGLPTSGTPALAALPGVTAFNYRGIAFLDLDAGVPGVDTLYAAANNDGTGTLRKFTFDGSTWTARGSVPLANAHGLAALDTGGGTVMLLATAADGSLYRLFDTSGHGGTLAGAPQLLASAAAGQRFMGLAWAPEDTAPAATPNAPAAVSATPSGNAVTVQWGAPADGAAPAYYLVELSRDDFATVDRTLAVFGTRQTVGGLSAGSYRARVRAVNSRGGGPATAAAAFTAADPPQLSLADGSAFSGVAGDPNDPVATTGIAFTLGDPVATAGSLTVSASSSNPAVVPPAGLALTHTGGQALLRITPAGRGYADITVTVANPSGATATRTLRYAASAAVAASAGTRWFTGRSDASTAIVLDAATMLVGDDEAPAQDAAPQALPGGNGFMAYARGTGGAPTAPLTLDAGALGLGSAGNADCATPGYSGLANCKTDGEMDTEASFSVGSRIYMAGSHSNNKSGRSRPDRWRFVAVDAGAGPALSTAGYYRWLREDLRAWDRAGSHGLGADYLGLVASSNGGDGDPLKAPETDTLSGFSIEGMSTSPGDGAAWLAFRAPLVAAPGQPAAAADSAAGRTHALIVPVANYAALPAAAGGTAGSATLGAPIRLDLGGRGIREIRKNGAGEYLIIAGPPNGATGTAPRDFRLYSWSGRTSAAGLALDLRLRDADVNAVAAPLTGCSPEGLAAIPDRLDAGGTVDVIGDCGDADFYGDGQAAKDLPHAAWKKFRLDPITLAPLAGVTLGDTATGATSLAFRAALPVDGTFHAVVLPAAAAAPSWEQVAAGQDAQGRAAPWASGPVALSAGVPASRLATGLAAATGYRLYGVAVTAAGHPGAIAVQAFTTAASGLPQSIAFDDPGNRMLGAFPFDASVAGGPSGQPLVLSSLSQAVCRVDGLRVTLLTAGTCTLRATQAGNALYGASDPVDRSFAVAPPNIAGATLAGSGGRSGAVSGSIWRFTAQSAGFQPASSLPAGPPPGIAFPFGIFSFSLASGTPGSTATLRLDLPQPAPAGATLWKYGRPTAGAAARWYAVAASWSADQRSVSYAVTDGGAGDEDFAVNGIIVDPVAVGVAAAPDDARAVPTLSQAAQALLGLCLAALAAWRMRRRMG
ncbi:hypothetical protein Acidovoranil_32190 [Acidovorax sp. FG27]